MSLKGKKVQKRETVEGIFTATVIAVNPDQDKISALSDGNLKMKDTPALKENEKTKAGVEFDQLRVRFLLKISKKDNGILADDIFLPMDFYLKSLSVDGGRGYWTGTSAGQVIYSVGNTREEAIALSESGEGQSFYVTNTSAEILGTGEKELFHFLSKSFNLNPFDKETEANYKTLYFPNPIVDGIETKDLQDDLDEYEPKVRVLLYVDKKGWQKVEVRNAIHTVFSVTDDKFVTRLEKKIAEAESKGNKFINDSLGKETQIQPRIYDPLLYESDEEVEDVSSAASLLG